MPCWHRWTVTDKTEQPSPVEQLQKSGQSVRSINGRESLDLFRRPVIVTYRCAKCGAEKVERI